MDTSEGEVVIGPAQNLTTDQTAAVLGVSRRTAIRLTVAGKLDPRLVGTQRRLTLRDG